MTNNEFIEILVLRIDFLVWLTECLCSANMADRDQEGETKRTGVLMHFLRVCKAFECGSNFVVLLQKSLFDRTSPEKVPKVKYFWIFFTDFSRQRLKWKLITSASYNGKFVLKSLKISKIFTKNAYLWHQFFSNSVFC